jgi:ATP-dependent RNA helicase DeaD
MDAGLPNFDDMQLSSAVRRAIEEMGFAQPTPVQSAAFGPAREGRDIVAQSRTGTGKTAAFSLPLADQIVPTDKFPQFLVLAPTRELANQVAAELGRIMKFLDLRVVAIYGGTTFGPQIDALKAGSHVVVGTPGRILDHLRRKNLKLDGIRWFVLDEADEMLSMGFKDELDAIVEYLPNKRQTLLFSATIPPEIRRMIDRYLTEPEELQLSGDYLAVEEVTHYYSITSHMRKGDTLLKFLAAEEPESAIIFCNTRDDTAFIANYLKTRGYDAELLSGDLTQAQRERAMKRIKAGNLRFLVATDVAARGIDISDLSHVINYALPESPDMYIHRTGRTGRAGKSGTAISIVSGLDIGSLYALTRWMKIRLEERPIPTEAEIQKNRSDRIAQRIAGRATDSEIADHHKAVAEKILAGEDAVNVVAHLVALAEAPPPEPPAEEKPEPADHVTSEARDEHPRSERKGSRRGEGRGRGRDRDRDRDRSSDRSEGRRSRKRGEDGSSRERSTRTPREGIKTIVITAGRRHDISRSDVVKFVVENSSLGEADVASVRVRPGITFVDVPEDKADATIKELHDKNLGERTVTCEMAKSQGGGKRNESGAEAPSTAPDPETPPADEPAEGAGGE